MIELPRSVCHVEYLLNELSNGNPSAPCIPFGLPDSPQAPERLWEWEKVHVGRLLWNATTFGRELMHRYFLTWKALAQENQRIWETDYLSCPLYEPWTTWPAWLDEYRELVRDVKDLHEEHHGRRHND